MSSEGIILTASLIFLAGSVAAQPAAGTVKTAGETMKNVHVLTDVPVNQWDDTMWFMSTSLGVSCEHCHTGQAYESDDRKAKLKARNMIQMTRELNAKNFNGRMRVTCYTCHQGSLQPKTASALWNKTPEEMTALKKEQQERQAASSSPRQEESLPDPEHVLAKYRKAVGAEGVKTIHLKAKVDTSTRGSFAVEMDIEMPDRLVQRAKAGGADIVQVIDRDRGWAVAPGRIVDMLPANLENARKQIALLGPVKVAEGESPRKTTGLETIGGRTFIVLESQGIRRLDRLYFDRQTGLLYKQAGDVQTPLGNYPYETVYDDYRDVDGIKVPFQITSRGSNDRTHYDYSEIVFNKPIDPSLFERPAAAGVK